MTRGLVIITADHLASARALATAAPFSLDEEAAAKMFQPAGSPTGAEPATHCWAAGLFTAPQWAALVQLAAALDWAELHEYDIDTQPGFPAVKLAGLGLQPMIKNTV